MQVNCLLYRVTCKSSPCHTLKRINEMIYVCCMYAIYVFMFIFSCIFVTSGYSSSPYPCPRLHTYRCLNLKLYKRKGKMGKIKKELMAHPKEKSVKRWNLWGQNILKLGWVIANVCACIWMCVLLLFLCWSNHKKKIYIWI